MPQKNKIMRIVLIGHTVGIKRCIESLKDSGEHSIIAVFTHQRNLHQHDLEIFEKRKTLFGEYAYDVFNVYKDYNIPLIEYENLNKEDEIKKVESFNPDIIITVGCREILNFSFIDRFRYVINLHPFRLPDFRGGGIDTWMILNGYCGTMQNATCHFIAEKIDAGRIIDTVDYYIPPSAFPLEIFKIRIDKLSILLKNSLKKLSDSSFQGIPQKDEFSRYFPKLLTHRDGKINFKDWSTEEINRFIQAFSYPYDGAFCIYEGKKIHLMKSEFLLVDEKIHPFSYGLIFKKEQEKLHVYAKGGYVMISEIEKDNNKLELNYFKLGKFLL